MAANTITDCTAVNDKATASATSGLTTTLATSGKTCTFTIEGSSTKSTQGGSQEQFRAALKDLARTLVLNPGTVPPLETFSTLLFSPFFSNELPGDLFNEFSNAAPQALASCLQNSIFDGRDFVIDTNSAAPVGCGVIRPTGQPVDITLPGTEGGVEVSVTQPAFAFSVLLQDVAFYTIIDLDRLRFEASN